jgi:hypothetical protein
MNTLPITSLTYADHNFASLVPELCHQIKKYTAVQLDMVQDEDMHYS